MTPLYKNELHEVILVLGHFGPWSSYLKMALKNEFFERSNLKTDRI